MLGVRAVAVLMILTAASFALPSPAAAAHEVGVGDLVTSFHYQPPSAFTGDLALRFVFDWGDENACRVLFGMSGVPSEAPLWGLVASDRGATYAMYYDYAVRAHGGDVTVHPAVVLGEDNWGFGIFEGVPRSGEEAFTIAGVGLARWVSPQGGVFENLFFQADCDDPFRVVAIAGGDTIHGFTELGGDGVGAAVYSPFQEAYVAVADGVAATMDEPLVSMVARVTGTVDSQHVGRYDITTPDGSASAMTTGIFAFDHTGGPGDYGFTTTNVGTGLSTTMFAAVVGLHPVDRLAGLSVWTG